MLSTVKSSYYITDITLFYSSHIIYTTVNNNIPALIYKVLKCINTYMIYEDMLALSFYLKKANKLF